MTHTAKIAQWGNSAALRLNADVLKEAKLKVGTPVEVLITSEGVLLKPQTLSKRMTLQEMIAACSPLAPMPAELEQWGSESAKGLELL